MKVMREIGARRGLLSLMQAEPERTSKNAHRSREMHKQRGRTQQGLKVLPAHSTSPGTREGVDLAGERAAKLLSPARAELQGSIDALPAGLRRIRERHALPGNGSDEAALNHWQITGPG